MFYVRKSKEAQPYATQQQQITGLKSNLMNAISCHKHNLNAQL